MGFPRQGTRVGCHFLLQGIYPTQGLNLHFLHCCCCSVAQFNSLWPHGLQHARPPCGRQILYHWATREAHKLPFIIVIQSLSRVWLFATPWTAACQDSLSFTFSQSCSNSCPLSQWCHPTISSSAIPFSSCLQSFPASGSFPMSQLFSWGGQSSGVSASASVLPMNIQNWFPLGCTGLVSLLSKGLSRVFSSTIVWKHQFFGTQPFYCPAFTSIHDYWKNHSFDYEDLCRQSNVSAF